MISRWLCSLLASASGVFGSNQNRQPGEKKKAGGIIDDIHLACVKPGLQRAERQGELEDPGLAVASIQFGQLDDGGFEYLGFAAEERDVRQQVNAGFDLSYLWRGGRIRPPWVINFVVEPQVLRGREDVGHVWNDLRSVSNQRAGSRTFLRGLKLTGEDNRAHLERPRLEIRDVQVDRKSTRLNSSQL